MTQRKRNAAGVTNNGKKKGNNGSNIENLNNEIENEDNLVFEDPFGDDEDDEDIVSEDEEHKEQDDSMDIEEEPQQPTKVWRPGVDPLNKDEVLDYDPSAYDLYYAMTAEWPALSIDIIRDKLGECRTKFPLTTYVVAGSQAGRLDENQVTVMKMSDLHKTKISEDSDDEDSDEEVDGDPILESRSVRHQGGVNRIRSMPQESHIVATWADTSKVHIWDLSKQLASLDGPSPAGMSAQMPPAFTFNGHPDEGFAMDWSSVQKGHFLTGDCKKYIYLWKPASEGGSSWNVDKIPFTGHSSSIEDLQWSPTEASVFSSCSSDGSVRIWDTRRKGGSMLNVTAHDDDVNVINWNRNVSYLMVSGSDDGSFKIWDLRNFKSNNPVAHFRYHTAPITSVEWHPTDESALAVSGADNQITIWDMSVEGDSEVVTSSANDDLPPQLLFIHQGQEDIKELHFHPQCPGVLVSTASDGFNVFKPANIS